MGAECWECIEGRRSMSNRFIGARQTTIAQEIQVHGTGVHSGAPVSVSLHPAGADTGLRFVVTKRGKVTAEIPAKVCNVKNLTLCTVIGRTVTGGWVRSVPNRQ